MQLHPRYQSTSIRAILLSYSALNNFQLCAFIESSDLHDDCLLFISYVLSYLYRIIARKAYVVENCGVNNTNSKTGLI